MNREQIEWCRDDICRLMVCDICYVGHGMIVVCGWTYPLAPPAPSLDPSGQRGFLALLRKPFLIEGGWEEEEEEEEEEEDEEEEEEEDDDCFIDRSTILLVPDPIA